MGTLKPKEVMDEYKVLPRECVEQKKKELGVC
jgi:hypothetical protein